MDLFGTAGIRGSVGERVSPELVVAVGRAVAAEAAEVVVARDGRLTGPALQAALIAGLESGGATVRDAGRLPTPALAFASRGRHGVMVTASHNPPEDNGIKVFTDGVEAGAEMERRIESRVADVLPSAGWEEWTDADREHVLPAYCSAVTEYGLRVGSGLDGLSIAVDCGNGMAGLAAPEVLVDLGGDVTALNANPDGHFPARESKPTPESLVEFREFVADGDDVLGVAYDGDADRIVIVAPDGEVVHEDTILAILAEHYVRESDAADPVVVTTPNASARVDERVEVAGGRVERCSLGALHEGIRDVQGTCGSKPEAEVEAEPTATVVFAGEPWKHIHPAFGGWIDGIVSAVIIAGLVDDSGGIADLRAPVAERPYRKVNVDCPNEDKLPVMAAVETSLPKAFPDASVDTEHGVRIDRPDGSWVLVRPSGTEPYIRLYAEAPDDVDELVARVTDIVREAVDRVATRE